MHPLRLLGWILLVVAFGAAAAETAAHGIAHNRGLMSAADVLKVLVPNIFDWVRDRVGDRLHPFAWDYVLAPLLTLPGWLLVGMPGVLLVWRFWPQDPSNANFDEFPEVTYEDIVAAAQEADDEDIGLPSKYRDLDEYDPTQPASDGSDAESEQASIDLEESDVIPGALYLPSRDDGGANGGGQSGSGGASRPF